LIDKLLEKWDPEDGYMIPGSDFTLNNS